MAIEFACPLCGSTIRVPDAASGKKGTCPACHSKLRVPVVDAPDAAPPAPPPEPESKPSKSKAAASKKLSKTKDDSDENAPKPTKRAKKEDAPFDPFLDALANPIHDEEETNTALLDALEAPRRKSKPTSKPEPPPTPPAAGKKSVAARFATVVEEPDEPGEEIPEFAAADSEGVSTEAILPSHFTDNSFEFAAPPPPVGGAVKKLNQQKARSGSNWIGIAFFVICGLGLVAGVAWFALQNDTTLGGDRAAQAIERGTQLDPRSPDSTLIQASEESIKTVLKLFKKAPPRIQTELIDTEFGVAGDELAITIREGPTAQFYRFPIDRELREFSKKNRKQMDARRVTKLKAGLKRFFEKWDVGIRNREHPKEFAFRDDVGICTCIGGLGYSISATVDGTVYPCVYEDEESLYFLLPRGTTQFTVVGRYGLEPENPPSLFPGTYRVVVKNGAKSKSSSKSKKDEPESEEMPEKKEGMMSAPTDDADAKSGDSMPAK